MSTEHTEQQTTDLETLRAVTAAAMDIFAAPPRTRAAHAYLRQRSVDPSGLSSSWLIGYAPPGWTRLVDTLRGEFDEQALLDAGLARRSSRGTLIDSFRNRVIFGIRNGTDGQLVGFIGRDLSGDPKAPKYLNTRQQPLFDKSSHLYGLHEGAKRQQARQPVVVEGPLDVLAIARRAQSVNSDLLPVAPCGTAFTIRHARQVAEVAFASHSPVVVAMDGDHAGRIAALGAGEQLRRLGLDVRIAQLPNGSDPAAYLARPNTSIGAFHTESALPLLTVRVEYAIAVQGDDIQWVEGRLAALRNIAAYLSTYPESYAVEQVPWLADTLNLQRRTVIIELADAFRGHPSTRAARIDSHQVDRSPILI